MDDLSNLRSDRDGFYSTLDIPDPAIRAPASSLITWQAVPCHGQQALRELQGGTATRKCASTLAGWVRVEASLTALQTPCRTDQDTDASCLCRRLWRRPPQRRPSAAREYIVGNSLLDRLTGLDDEGRTYLHAQLADRALQKRLHTRALARLGQSRNDGRRKSSYGSPSRLATYLPLPLLHSLDR